MSLFSDKRNYDTAFTADFKPEEAEDFSKSFTDSFLDNWHFQTYTANSYSREDNLHDEFEKEIAKIESVTGEKLKNPYNSAFGEFFADTGRALVDEMRFDTMFDSSKRSDAPINVALREQEKLDKYYKRVNELKAKYPELNVRDIDTINNDIKKQAQELYAKVNDGKNSSWWGDFLGSAAGAMTDPINAFTSLIGGGLDKAKDGVVKALGKTAVREFVENATVESLIQPSVYKYKKELELDYSAEEAVGNVFAAGVGGSVLGTAGKALGMTKKQILAKYKKAEASGVKFSADVKQQALELEEGIKVEDWIDRSNPFGDGVTEKVLHENSIVEEMRQLTKEKQDLSKAYDDVLSNPVGDPTEELAQISPEYMEDIWVNRGGYNKNNGVKGSGYGMVKFIFKHGEKSTDLNPIAKEDVLNFPSVVREYEPIIDSRYHGNMTWSVKNSDGKQVIYAVRNFAEDGKQKVVTIHIAGEKDHNFKDIFSRRREAKPAHTMDTTQKTFSRADESSVETSTPKSRFQGGDDVIGNNISQEAPKVKDYESISLDDLENEINSRTDLSAEEKSANLSEIQKMRDSDNWDNEILECIVEYGKK